MTRAEALIGRPPDDLPEARVWRPDLLPVVVDHRPGLPIQPALFPVPRRATSRRRPFGDLLDAARLDQPAHPAGAASPRRRAQGLVQVSVMGAPPSRDLPDVRRWSVNLGLALVEVLLGHRALAQLLRWLGDDALGVLGVAASAARDRETGRVPRQRIAVVSARVQLIDARTVEACLHATRASERYVVAFRLVAENGRWVCTELDLLTPRFRP